MDTTRALALIGPMGAGKSVVGARVAQRLGWRFIDLDAEVERRHGLGVAALFARDGEAAFRAAESAALHEAMEMSESVVATGGGAVLDAGNRALMSAGFVVHLHVDVDAQLDRLRGDTARPLLAVEDRDTRLRTLAEVRGPLYAQVEHLRIDTTRMAIDDVVGHVLDAWQAARA